MFNNLLHTKKLFNIRMNIRILLNIFLYALINDNSHVGYLYYFCSSFSFYQQENSVILKHIAWKPIKKYEKRINWGELTAYLK